MRIATWALDTIAEAIKSISNLLLRFVETTLFPMHTLPTCSLNLQQPGQFTLGCNYWASHAGTAMWSDWQPDVVRGDFAKLSSHGLEVLRVFPLWPDFQPITQLRGGAGAPVEIRFGEQPLPFDEIGQAGLSRLMLERFAEFCRLAEDAGLKLIVGLVTG